MIKHTFSLLAALTIFQHGKAQEITANDLEIQQSNRPDGREQSTYTIVHDLLKQTQPKYAYKYELILKWLKDILKE